MTTFDEEKTPTVPHAIPYRALVVMPSLHPRLSTPGSVRSTTPIGGAGAARGSTLAPFGTIPLAPTSPPRGSAASVSPVSSNGHPPPLPSRLIRVWPRLSPENRALVESLALALLPPAVDVSRR